VRLTLAAALALVAGATPAAAGMRIPSAFNPAVIPKSCFSPRMAALERRYIESAMEQRPDGEPGQAVSLTRLPVSMPLPGETNAGPGYITCPVSVLMENSPPYTGSENTQGWFTVREQQTGEVYVEWSYGPFFPDP